MKIQMNRTEVFSHGIIVLAFVILVVIYCAPVLDGKTLMGHDLESWTYMAKETMDFNAKGGGQTFWTNSMFGGMPTYQISAPMGQNSLLSYLPRIWGS